ncbi:hypothetical protein HYT84_03385 [Candidatus Micrarchaeota archaeon]|nr:hypothetical protein [Candidatus Micrarchaeota archaeon]
MKLKHRDLTAKRKWFEPNKPGFTAPERKRGMGSMRRALRDIVGLLFSTDFRDRMDAASALRCAQERGIGILEYRKHLEVAFRRTVKRIKTLRSLPPEDRRVSLLHADAHVRSELANILSIRLEPEKGSQRFNCDCPLEGYHWI